MCASTRCSIAFAAPKSPARVSTTLAEAKRLHEIVKVQRAKLAFEREQGQLVETLAATRTVFARARAERDAHMAWVQRTAALLAAEVGADPRATFAALDRMMREHLEYLVTCRWPGCWPAGPLLRFLVLCLDIIGALSSDDNLQRIVKAARLRATTKTPQNQGTSAGQGKSAE
jgi:hypothetical protein